MLVVYNQIESVVLVVPIVVVRCSHYDHVGCDLQSK